KMSTEPNPSEPNPYPDPSEAIPDPMDVENNPVNTENPTDPPLEPIGGALHREVIRRHTRSKKKPAFEEPSSPAPRAYSSGADQISVLSDTDLALYPQRFECPDYRTESSGNASKCTASRW
ncbi:hypothetical protein Dimus_030418, partial [Dionaea muscipula]